MPEAADLYFWRDSIGPVDLAFTDRLGGASRAPFDELDLTPADDDDPDAVAADRRRNHRLVIEDFAPGTPLADMRQVHGAEVATARAGGPRPTCDGLVAGGAGAADVTLMVRVADCVPVLLADPDAGVVGVVHAGRPGVLAGVVPATVARMRAAGAGAITGWIGPHVCGACYEVPAGLQDEVAAAVPETRATTSWGTPALDLGAGVHAQLRGEGVAAVEVSACTRESATLYSYRRDGARSGRQAGLVRLRGTGR